MPAHPARALHVLRLSVSLLSIALLWTALTGAAAATGRDPDLEELERRFMRARGGDRDEVWAKLQELCEADELGGVVQRRALKLSRGVARAGITRKLAKLASERQELDRLRAEAIRWIEDAEAYVFPFDGPDVPKKSAKAYAKVRDGIVELEEEIEEAWGSERAVKLSSAYRTDLDELDWTVRRAVELGLEPEVDSALPAWALAVQAVASEGRPSVDLRSMALDAADAAQILRNERVLRHNARLADDLRQPDRIGLGSVLMSAAEATLAEQTNAYRAMFGRGVLVLDERLFRAARGHAEYLADRDDLTHYQHVNDTTRTPRLRGKSEGYFGAFGETLCARQGSPRDVVRVEWCSHSPSHRNILSKKAEGIGAARSGRVWVQLLGEQRVPVAELRGDG